MALEVPYEDLRRDFLNCVVMYQNTPVYISGVTPQGDVTFRELLSQELKHAKFTLKDFGAPVLRVGMVNVNNSVVYVSRMPYRKYYMGLHMNNTAVDNIPSVRYEMGEEATKSRIRSLCVKELGQAIMNKYPTFKEALENVKKLHSACAFDKQFAINKDFEIIYKTNTVGIVDKNAKSVNDINWDGGFSHLALLLEKNYEKAVRDFQL